MASQEKDQGHAQGETGDLDKVEQLADAVCQDVVEEPGTTGTGRQQLPHQEDERSPEDSLSNSKCETDSRSVSDTSESTELPSSPNTSKTSPNTSESSNGDPQSNHLPVAENGQFSDADCEDNSGVVKAEVARTTVVEVEIPDQEVQASPSNPPEKLRYERDFLLLLSAAPASRTVPSIPDIPQIKIDGTSQVSFGRGFLNVTPGFFRSSGTAGFQSGCLRSTSQHGNMPGRRGRQSSQPVEPQRVLPSVRREVRLHKAENAYKPSFQADVEEDSKEETNKLFRTFQSILNKLCPEKYEKLSENVQKLKINSEERLNGVTDLLYKKAIAEPHFVKTYAALCKDMLIFNNIPKKPTSSDHSNAYLSFRVVLLKKCQKEFESSIMADGVEKKREQTCTLGGEDGQATLEPDEESVRARRRATGNIIFIGELFKKQILLEGIMHDCILKLIRIRDNDSLEYLTKLLFTVGKDLDHAKAKERMDHYFAQLESIVRDIPTGKDSKQKSKRKGRKKDRRDAGGNSNPEATNYQICSRVRCSVLDVLELRRNHWVKRQIHEGNQPVKLGDIKTQIRQEQLLHSLP